MNTESLTKQANSLIDIINERNERIIEIVEMAFHILHHFGKFHELDSNHEARSYVTISDFYGFEMYITKGPPRSLGYNSWGPPIWTEVGISFSNRHQLSIFSVRYTDVPSDGELRSFFVGNNWDEELKSAYRLKISADNTFQSSKNKAYVFNIIKLSNNLPAKIDEVQKKIISFSKTATRLGIMLNV